MTSAHPDVAHAAQLLERGLRLGDPFAAYALGTWFFHGINGFTQDRKMGIKLFKIAADAKVPHALFDLANSYEMAYLLYLDAAIRGDKQAVFEVARRLTYGIGTVRDPVVAGIWAARARELGAYEEE